MSDRKIGSFAGINGRVSKIKYGGEYGAQVIVVSHNKSRTLVFNHLDKVYVKVGQVVVPETCLGYNREVQPWWFR